MPGLRLLLLFALLSLGPPTSSRAAEDHLVPLARPGPWPGVSGLVAYGARLWFVNSVKFVDHNSADLYSYDPVSGEARYERHLFSQDAGEPAVLRGLLYWPFEDPRFSTGRGEYLVTNGRDWQWRILPGGKSFHVHAMTAHRGDLFAATSAWRAGLQRSEDGGLTWRIIYDHPTAPGFVSRLTTLASVGGTLYAGLRDFGREGVGLLRSVGNTLHPVSGWPQGSIASRLVVYRGWLYAVNTRVGQSTVWRTDGDAVERVTGLGSYRVRALAAGPGALWAVSADGRGAILWRSTDGMSWTQRQRFSEAEPLDLVAYAGRVYVGTAGPEGRGTLWGPSAPAPAEPPIDPTPLPRALSPLSPAELAVGLGALDLALADELSYRAHGLRLLEILEPLGRSRLALVGRALTQRLDGRVPHIELTLFGGKLTVSASKMARWYLLWAMALNGHGRVPPSFLMDPWTERPNRAEKYLEPVSAAAWAVAQLGQADTETLGALIARLGRNGDPPWLTGDLIGALTALTGERFGYDLRAWRAWWARGVGRSR